MSLTESQSLFLSNSVRDNNMMLFLLWNGILYIWRFPLRKKKDESWYSVFLLLLLLFIYFLDFSYVYDGQAISLQFKLCNTAVPEYHVSWWALILDPGDTHNTRWKNLIGWFHLHTSICLNILLILNTHSKFTQSATVARHLSGWQTHRRSRSDRVYMRTVCSRVN